MENYQFLTSRQKYFEGKAAKRTGNHIGYGLLVFIGVYVFLEIAASLLVQSGIISLSLARDPVFNTIYSTVVSLLAFLGGGLVIFAAERKNIYDAVSYDAPKSGDHYTLIIIGIGVCFAASYIMSYVTYFLQGTALEPKMPDIGMPRDIAGFLAYLIMVSVIPAICEEFMFRGAVLQSLRKFGDRTALVVSTVLFALMHGNLVQIPFALAAGFVMGYAALKTGSLLIPMAIHFGNNLIATLFSYIAQVSGSQTVEAALTLIELAIIVAAIVLAILYIKKHGFLNFMPQIQLTSPAVLRAKIVFSPATIPFLCYVALNIIAVQLTN